MTYAGVDRKVYPGDDFMSGLMSNTNLLWTAFYLAPTPQRKDASWMAKRETLREQGPGWGLLPVFLGQQQPGGTLTEQQGTKDGEAAVTVADKAGFGEEDLPGNAVVYLDIEQGGTLSSAWIDYVDAWCAHIRSQETVYLPGIYCSYRAAPQVAANNADARIWVWNINKYKNRPAEEALTDVDTFLKPDMAEAGYADADAWQWKHEYPSITTTLPAGGKQTVAGWDLDVSTIPDPSRPDRTYDDGTWS